VDRPGIGRSASLADGVAVLGGSRAIFLFDASNGDHLSTIPPRDGAPLELGDSVSVSDGLLAVGDSSDDVNGNKSGSALLFDVSDPADPVQMAKILPNDGVRQDLFGESVALSEGVLIVGAPGEDTHDTGAAYLFNVTDPAKPIQLAKLIASDRTFGDYFGNAVAISDGLAVAGATESYYQSEESGDAYVFDVNCAGGCLRLDVANLLAGERAALTVLNGTPGEKALTVFGFEAGETEVNNVAGYCATFGINGLNRSQILEGVDHTFGDDGRIEISIPIPGNAAGRRFLFQSAQRGTCPAECVSNVVERRVGRRCEPAHRFRNERGSQYGAFGATVALESPVAAVGVPDYGARGEPESGLVTLFDTRTGEETAQLVPNDVEREQHFGSSIAISSGLIAVGSSGDEDLGENSGSAYLFDASTAEQTAKLLPDDGGRDDFFGSSIAVDQGLVVVGSPRDDDLGENAGAAYLFDIANPGNPGQTAKLLPVLPDGDAEDDKFGRSVAIDDGLVVVGAEGDDDNGKNSGAAYLFDVTDPANPVQVAKILPDDGRERVSFGSSVAIDDHRVAVGARYDDVVGINSGSAYLFDVTDPANPVQTAKLLPDDGASRARFGQSIALADGLVAVGASSDDDNGRSGSTYLFDVSTGVQLAKLLPENAPEADFGASVAADKQFVLVGALNAGENGGGMAFLYDAQCTRGCLTLGVEPLIAGEPATFTITGGMPGARAVTVYGSHVGETLVPNQAG